MPAFAFMPKFVGKCLSGDKPHTIRALRKDGQAPRVGTPFFAYCGMRQASCSWLFTSEIVKVEAIRMESVGHGAPFIRKTEDLSCELHRVAILPHQKTTALIAADGFEVSPQGTAEMHFCSHFFPKGKADPFTGHLIHWRPEDAKATVHSCPDCGERLKWSEAIRGFLCVCTMTERIHRFKRPTQ